jgi:hypothetical protein
MPDPNPENIPLRALAVALLQSGQLTVPEVANLACVSRQAVHMWARKARIDPAKARAVYVNKIWQKYRTYHKVNI